MQTGIIDTHIKRIKKYNSKIKEILKSSDEIADYLNKINKITPGTFVDVNFCYYKRGLFYNNLIKENTRDNFYFVTFGLTRYGNVKVTLATDKELNNTFTLYHGGWYSIEVRKGKKIFTIKAN